MSESCPDRIGNLTKMIDYHPATKFALRALKRKLVGYGMIKLVSHDSAKFQLTDEMLVMRNDGWHNKGGSRVAYYYISSIFA